MCERDEIERETDKKRDGESIYYVYIKVTCALPGEPEPEIWWERYDRTTDAFVNVTLTDRVMYTPSRHLIIKAARILDAGVYRCMGFNPCGKRCPGEPTCPGERVVSGHNFTLEVKPKNDTMQFRAYLILDKTRYNVTVAKIPNRCLLLEETEKCLAANIDVGFHPLHSIEGFLYGSSRVVSKGDGPSQTNTDGLCIFNCSSQSNRSPEVFSIKCTEFDGFSQMCDFFNKTNDSIKVGRFSYTAHRSYPNQIKPQSEQTTLSSRIRNLNFTVLERNEITSIKCYHNLRLIEQDKRTRIFFHKSKGHFAVLQRIRIHKSCVMRDDEGDYFCSLENLFGLVVSSPITVSGTHIPTHPVNEAPGDPRTNI